MATKLGPWELKQIIDIVSKGVNSVLMNSKEVPDKDTLKTLAENLTEIYIGMIENLKEQKGEEVDVPIKTIKK